MYTINSIESQEQSRFDIGSNNAINDDSIDQLLGLAKSVFLNIAVS